MKRHHMTKFQSKVRLPSVKSINWKQRRKVLAFDNVLKLIKAVFLPVINHLSWYGAVCFRLRFSVQQKQECDFLNSYTAGASKLSSGTEFHVPNYQIDSLKKEINEKLFAKADFLVDKILCCPRIKLSNTQTLLLAGVETGVLR